MGYMTITSRDRAGIRSIVKRKYSLRLAHKLGSRWLVMHRGKSIFGDSSGFPRRVAVKEMNNEIGEAVDQICNLLETKIK